jgi:integrase
MPDTRYLKLRRGSRWSIQVKVPVDLRKKVGKPTIERALGTSDLREAQRLRWQHLAEIHDKFERLRDQRTLAPNEIEREAQRVYRRLLEDAETARQQGKAIADAPTNLVAVSGEPAWPTRELAGLDLHKMDLADSLHDHENWMSDVENDAQRIIENVGADIPEESDSWNDLCRALTHARLEAFRAIIAQREGMLYVPPAGPFHRGLFPWQLVTPATSPSVRPRGPATLASTIVFSDAAERFLESRQRDPSASWTQQTRLQAEASFRLFRDYADDPQLSEVNRESAAGYLETISRLHPDYGRSPRTKSLTLWQLLEHHSVAEGQPGLSNRTINRHATALRQIWRWALRRGLLPDGSNNPFDDQTRPTGRQSRTGWRPMTIEELNILLQSPLLTKASSNERLRPTKHTPQTALSWAPLIALFSGMRLGEICQLRVGDIINENGINFFNVSEDGTQRIKTEAGIRRVPVHSELIRCEVKLVSDKSICQSPALSRD